MFLNIPRLTLLRICLRTRRDETRRDEISKVRLHEREESKPPGDRQRVKTNDERLRERNGISVSAARRGTTAGEGAT